MADDSEIKICSDSSWNRAILCISSSWLSGDGRAWKFDGRAQALVGQGLAMPLVIVLSVTISKANIVVILQAHYDHHPSPWSLTTITTFSQYYCCPTENVWKIWLIKIYFDQPNAGKVPNGRLLFVADITVCH